MYERAGHPWGSLGCLGDPIPGSPDVLTDCASSYRSSAENLSRAVDNLRRLRSTEQTSSEAVEKILADAVAAAGSLDQVRERYDTISRALTSYAPELREAQRMSIQAVTDAAAAVRQRQAALARNEAARQRCVTVDQAVREQALEDYHVSKADYLRADAHVESAKALLAQAIAKRDAAGESAKGMIGGCIGDSPLNDGLGDYLSAAWEKISEVTAKVINWIWDHIDEICLVLDILSVVLALTGVGGPVAAALQAVRHLAKLAHVVGKIKGFASLAVGAYRWATTGDASDFLNSGLSLALSFAGGKVLDKLKVGDKLGAKVAKWTTARAEAHMVAVTGRTMGPANQVLKAALSQGNSATTIMRRVPGAVLPAVHPAAPTVNAMLGSQNEIAASVAPKVTAALSLMNSAEYARVAPAVAQLEHMATGAFNATLSGNALNHVVTQAVESAGSERLVDSVVGVVSGKVADRVFPCEGYELIPMGAR